MCYSIILQTDVPIKELVKLIQIICSPLVIVLTVHKMLLEQLISNFTRTASTFFGGVESLWHNSTNNHSLGPLPFEFQPNNFTLYCSPRTRLDHCLIVPCLRSQSDQWDLEVLYSRIEEVLTGFQRSQQDLSKILEDDGILAGFSKNILEVSRIQQDYRGNRRRSQPDFGGLNRISEVLDFRGQQDLIGFQSSQQDLGLQEVLAGFQKSQQY